MQSDAEAVNALAQAIGDRWGSLLGEVVEDGERALRERPARVEGEGAELEGRHPGGRAVEAEEGVDVCYTGGGL